MDDSDVKLVILFAVRDVDKGSAHIKALAKISVALGDDDIVEQLIKSESSEELYDLIVNSTDQ